MAEFPILILAALRFEAQAIAHELNLTFISRATAHGFLAGAEITLRIVGPAARHLPAPPSICRAVIMAGLAGALSADLQTNDVVVDEQSDVLADLPFRRGAIATVERLASTPANKSALHQATGAIAVDMENAIVRKWARVHHLKFLGIRIISDTSNETLDPATLRVIDDRGFLKPLRLIGEVIRRPTVIRLFWRLRTTQRTVRELAISVRRAVGVIISESPQRPQDGLPSEKSP